ncbi:MAG: hypothetical protein HY298_17075 [Verrucomicrobia bacterium]|nr:hypothetical protein [Verrucomicrobiota bacterium]
MNASSEGSTLKAATPKPERPSSPLIRKSVFGVCQVKNLHRLLISGTLLAGVLAAASSASAAQKLWNGLAGDTFWSSGGNWSLAGAPGVSDNVAFTNDGVAADFYVNGGAVNNVVDAGFLNSINSLGYMNTNGFHNSQIINNLSVLSTSATDVASIADDGQPSVFFVGSNQWQDGKDDSVYATIIGDSLTVSNENANLGVTQISTTSGAHRATLDLTPLNTFNCVVSNVLVGHNFTIVDHAWRPTGTLFLAKTNSITTHLITVASVYQNAGGPSFIHLGQANTVNADKLRIGVHKNNGTLDMTPGLATPALTFRNTVGTGRQISWEIGDMFEPNTNTIGFFSSGNATGTIDLSGANVDALVDLITLGRGQIQVATNNRAGDGVGSLTFGGGTVDANNLQMGIQYPGPYIGGSVGRGTINVNNDAGVGPALLNVRSNIVMAVQYPISPGTSPNTPDATGSQGTINVNDGSTVAVAGDIVSGGPGGGTAIINLNNGGKLDMKPAGDATPGNVSINILNISDGIITNYGTLSLTNITFPAGGTLFTVYPGQAIAAARVGTLGPLDVAGDLTLRGTTLLDIGKNGATLANDVVSATGVVNLGGTLKVTFSGSHDNLVVGDKFTLFAAVPVNSAPTVILPPPGSGLAWNNKVFVDGSIEVVSCGCGEPTTPPTITASNSPTTISLSWPTAYTSFALYGQTNPITIGLRTNWGLVPGVVANQVTLPIDPANGSVFFQLFQQ